MYPSNMGNALEEELDAFEEGYDSFGMRYNASWPGDQEREWSPTWYAPTSVGWTTTHFQCTDPSGYCSPVTYSDTSYECLNPCFSVHQETVNAGNLRDVFESGDALGFGQCTPCQTAPPDEIAACLGEKDGQASDLEALDHEIINLINPAKAETTLEAPKVFTESRSYGGVPGGVLPAKTISARDAYRIPCPSGSRDRHCRVLTSKGPRERRIRLSKETALKFYDVQHRLGYDQASKAVEWLIHKSKSAIDGLPQISPTEYLMSPSLHSSTGSVSPFQTGQAISDASRHPGFVLKNGGRSSSNIPDFSAKLPSALQQSSSGSASPCESNKYSSKRLSCKDHSDVQSYVFVEQQRNSSSRSGVGLQSRLRIKAANALKRMESRAKARERARERTKQKICTNECRKSSHIMDDQFSYETNPFPTN